MIGAKLKELRKKLHLTREARLVIYQIFLFVLGVTLTPVRFLFGVYPFGIALLGATRKYAPFVFAGAILGVIFFMDADIVYIIALIALLGLRVAGSFIKRTDFKRTELGKSRGAQISEILFMDGVELRVSVASLVSLGVGIYGVISRGYVYYDIFGLVFYTVLVGVLTFCMCGFFQRESHTQFLMGLAAIVFSVAYLLSGREIQGFDLMLLLSVGIVLYISKYLGGIKSGIVGVILGIASGGTVCAVLGICGVVSGLLWGVSSYLAIMCAAVLGTGYAIGVLGYDAIVYLLPEILTASLIMYPLLRFELLPKITLPQKAEEKGMTVYRLENKSIEMKRKMGALALSLSEVAKILKGVSQKMREPTKRGYMDMALEECEGYCYACPKYGICWERDIETTEKNINAMGERLFTQKRIEYSDLEQRFLHRCPNIEKIIDGLNVKSKKIAESSVRNDKLETCAQDYEAISRIIASSFKEKSSAIDKALTEKAIRAAARCGLVAEKIEVTGGTNKRVVATGVDVQRSKCTSLELRREMEQSLAIPLKEAETTENDGYTILTMERENRFRVELFAESAPKDKNEVNGDSYACFEAGAHQYMVICDGMGSGMSAGLTSRLCVDMLSKMLSATGDTVSVLSMLNSIVRAKSEECSSTVDLFEFDLITGEGRFVKSGACPSFVKRGKNVYTLQSKTAPIGIMKRLDAEELNFSLNKGDVCVMMSDGVAESAQDVKWITKYLSEAEGDEREITKGILTEIKRRGIKDDVTVISAVIN